MSSRLDGLPFVQDTPGSARVFWKVQPTGDYAKDCETGRGYARATRDYLLDGGAPSVLGQIASAMPPRPWSGVETGYFQGIASAAMGASI